MATTKLVGGPGDDKLFGRFGNNEELGGDDADVLEGGRGDDTLPTMRCTARSATSSLRL